MKTQSSLTNLSVLAIALLVSFAACSSVNNEVETITDEDVDLAAQIVATSLADDESGMMSSLYDAFSTVDESGINYGEAPGERFKADDRRGEEGRPPNGRGREHNFEHSYDSTTGIHTLTFERSVEGDDFSKSIEIYQEIIFTDLDGGFLAEPRVDKDAIEAISFYGTKAGSAEGLFRSHSFNKEDDFELSGIHETSPILYLNGTHSGSGSGSGITRDSVQASREYSIDISFENVEVNKDTVKAYGNLENGVTGTLTYSMTMSKTINGVPEETEMEGTIDLEEDGTALMRFKGLPQVVRFSLSDGKDNGRPPHGDRDNNRRGGQ